MHSPKFRFSPPLFWGCKDCWLQPRCRGDKTDYLGLILDLVQILVQTQRMFNFIEIPVWCAAIRHVLGNRLTSQALAPTELGCVDMSDLYM